MTDLAISYLPLSDLAPYPKNARTHTPEQIAQIAASIREYGWTNPVLVDEHNSVIAGHGRLLAASSLGREQVPTIALQGLTAAQKQALRIADNKLALNAGWDAELLRMELGDLKLEGFDLGFTGFREMEIDQFFAPDTDAESEWQGMPEFNQNDKSAYQTVAVHFRDQEEVQAFSELIGQPLTNKTRFVWFRAEEIERYVDKRYVSEQSALSDLHSVEG